MKISSPKLWPVSSIYFNSEKHIFSKLFIIDKFKQTAKVGRRPDSPSFSQHGAQPLALSSGHTLRMHPTSVWETATALRRATPMPKPAFSQTTVGAGWTAHAGKSYGGKTGHTAECWECSEHAGSTQSMLGALGVSWESSDTLDKLG